MDPQPVIYETRKINLLQLLPLSCDKIASIVEIFETILLLCLMFHSVFIKFTALNIQASVNVILQAVHLACLFDVNVQQIQSLNHFLYLIAWFFFFRYEKL